MIVSSFIQAAFGGLKRFLPVFFISAFLPNLGWASNFSVSPVRVHLSADRNIAALKVHNAGDTSISIQAEGLLWDQENGLEQLKRTRELLVTPPIFTVAPGATQIIRVGLRSKPDNQLERTFRMYLTELPPPETDAINGLQVATRISLPVFVDPIEGETAFELTWKAHLTHAGDLTLTGTNNGNGHARVGRLRVTFANGASYREKGNFYLLPKSTRSWTIPAAGIAATPGSTIDLVVEIDGDSIPARVQLD